MNKGKYIVIEGAEGVGKSTVAQMIAQQLQAAQMPVQMMREPDSQNDLTARTIRRLTQDPRYPMNTRTEALLYNAARSQSLQVIQELTDNGVTCLVDRSYLTTLAIQYYGRGDVQDYQKLNDIIEFALGDVQPDLMLVLDAPVATLRERVKFRPSTERFDNLDDAFLERVRAGYLWEAKQRNLPVVYANEGVDAVFKAVWQHVAATLAVRSKDKPNSGVQSVAEVLAAKPATKAAAVEPPLPSAVTNHASATAPQTAGAADPPPATNLVSQSITIVDASSLLARKLQNSKHATYLESPPRQAASDQKDAAGHYPYFVPTGLKGKLRSQYIKTMNQIFDTYSKLLADVTAHVRATSATPAKQQDNAWEAATKAQACDALYCLLPAATKSTVEIYAPAGVLESLGVHLLGDELPEARIAGQQTVNQAHQMDPTLADKASKSNRNATTVAYRTNTYGAVQKLAVELLPAQHTSESPAVTLASYMPHNELDVVADMLYEHSDLPLEVLKHEAASWPYQRKLDVFNAYIGDRPSRHQRPGCALESVRYTFDLVCDSSILRDLQQHHAVDALEWQQLSPRMGYNTPTLVEQAGQSDTYADCFDLSLQLYSALQAAGHPLEAQYATLLGHKTRCRVTYNARQAFRLHEAETSTQGHPDYYTLVQQMHEKVAEVHPLLAEAMKFVSHAPTE